MELKALGYVGIGASNLDEWSMFATRFLGMQATETSSLTRAFRMDDQKQRLFIDSESAEGARIFGWEANDGAALQKIAARLENAGVPVTHEGSAMAARRCVTELISFPDPVGNRLEVFHGPQITNDPFQPGRAISGFRTGALGLGHAVLMVERLETVRPFYEQLLGFQLSDYMAAPFKACFFHTNARHHSLALIESGKNGIHHLMVELYSLDDVGQAYDLALSEKDRIGVTLGRHTNDFMTSFYAKSPSQFLFEYGWGGRNLDPSTWRAQEMTKGPSFWGHERYWLPAEDRQRARELCLEAAMSGSRAPVQVLQGNHDVAADVCPWWNGIDRAAGKF
jgi:2,3-dihydroxybiphenyl 1,2-dioxygenase